MAWSVSSDVIKSLNEGERCVRTFRPSKLKKYKNMQNKIKKMLMDFDENEYNTGEMLGV